MKLRLSLLPKIFFSLLGALLLALVLLWFFLPRILQSQAEQFIAEKTGHKLVMDRPELNLFQLSLRLGKLRLTDPAGKPLLGFDALLVDFSGASFSRRAPVFDAIRVDGVTATLVEMPEGKLNWTPFLAALESREEAPQPAQGLPRLEIRSLVLSGGVLDYADQRRTDGFATRIEPLDLELKELSTFPDDTGKYKVSARTTFGAQVDLDGEIDLNPVKVSGKFSLADLQLAKLAPYLKDALPIPPEGVLNLSASYQAGNAGAQFDATVEQIQARLTDARVVLQAAGGPEARLAALELRNGRFELGRQTLSIDEIALENGALALPGLPQSPHFAALSAAQIAVSLAERQATVGKLHLVGGRVHALRSAAGRIDLQDALQALSGSRPSAAVADAPQPAAAPPWRYLLEQVELVDLGVVLQDASVQPALELAIDRLAAKTQGVSQDLSVPLPLNVSFDVRSGGRFAAEGKLTPATTVADFGFRLSDLSLKPAQPFLTEKTTLALADGKFSAQGRVRYNEKGPLLKGEFALRDLRLMEPGVDRPLLALKLLGSRDLRLTQKALHLGELNLVGLDTRLLIDKDKNINFKQVMKPAGAAPPAETVPPGAVPPTPSFIVSIDRVRFETGQMDFADQSLILPFGTRIHDLKGSIAGLSNRPGAVGEIELDGQVDAYGMARAVGQVELDNPTNGLDLRVQFRNVEMTNLTPYTAHFAGRKIDSGKLSLDLQYKIVKRQLQGENQVIMDQLTLGERVEHPDASSLPLDLALALLKDSDGRIDLGLPVSGSLDDPQFSYGALVWKAITNVLTKIVTAPFRALGALFGGGGEKVEAIVFEAGNAQLAPPEREKVAKLAQALGKRPGLDLSLGGVHVAADRIALQDVQLRRSVLARAGQRVPESGDPGPLSTQQPKIREALEALYKERVGAADLDALKAGFRSANPGQLEEGVAGKMVSRLTGLLREKKTLDENAIARLKGVDYYAVLFEQLRAQENIPDTRLQALAQGRTDFVADLLGKAGVDAKRLRLLAPEKAQTEEGAATLEVPLRLSLEAAKSK
jgi:hypothetical protein